MIKPFTFLASLLVLSSVQAIPPRAEAQPLPAQANANNKYQTLLQVLPCPSDRGTYGSYRDYGYWGGGSWCNQQGRAGYWVWVYPNWYVWQQKADPNQSVMLQPASLQGKYSTLLQILNCPSDRSTYGEFRDYGYWGGGQWCGQQGAAGHWVWMSPNWYIWQNKHR